MILVAAGSNLPFCGVDSQQIVIRSFFALRPFCEEIKISSLYASPAWPDRSDPDFVNAAARLDTDLGPRALLAVLQNVEAAFGRRRAVKNAPRTLDLDLIVYDEVITADPDLTLPHPRFAARDFVLAPICELAPSARAPEGEASYRALLDALPERAARRIA